MIKLTKKYRYRNGRPARVLCVDRPIDEVPVVSMTEAGSLKAHTGDGRNSARDGDFDLIEVTPYEHIRDGDIVEVYDPLEERTMLRRFAGVTEGGIPMTYGEDVSFRLKWEREPFRVKWDGEVEIRLVCRKENAE